MVRDTDTSATRSRASTLIRVMEQLEGLSVEMPERELIQEGLEIAQAATASRIGYLHYLNEDEETLELGTWSRTTRDYCTALHDRHYPIGAAGIWADSARSKQPCVHNDYAATPNKRGLPEGHSALARHLGVPVLAQGRVRLLIGVGNKDTDYDEADVDLVQRVGQRVWSLVRQRRDHERHLDNERRFRRVQEIAAVCGWEYDVDDDLLRVDAMFAHIFLTRGDDDLPAALDPWLRFVVPSDHQRLRVALSTGEAGVRRRLRLQCERLDGRTFPAELRIEFRQRDVGSGLVAVGILQDVTEHMEVEELRRRADMDALTGLPNRHRLMRLFADRAAGGVTGAAGVAFFFIDLDDFKPVNDTHGHAVGDEVLRIVANRLRHMVRKDDLVVRVGGDEFAIVQLGVGAVNAHRARREGHRRAGRARGAHRSHGARRRQHRHRDPDRPGGRARGGECRRGRSAVPRQGQRRRTLGARVRRGLDGRGRLTS
jgi:GGDEF domain-containing protein/PAS domain-containing protein